VSEPLTQPVDPAPVSRPAAAATQDRPPGEVDPHLDAAAAGAGEDAGEGTVAQPDPTPDVPAGADLPTGEDVPADFRTVLVSTVTVDLPNQHATVVLRESDSPRRHLSFSIGIPDAVALSHALRRITTPRPLTHELMSAVLQQAEVDLVAVRMVGRQGTVYFAELDVRSRVGRGMHACRPSDGLTLALLQRVPVPILVDRRLLEETGDVTPG
jgi:uncharacterized protein